MRLPAALLMLPALVAAIPAFAQRKVEHGIESRISTPAPARFPEDAAKADRARVVMAEFARCTIDRSSKRVNAVLEMPLGAEYATALRRMVSSDCLAFEGDLRFQPIVIRGAMFSELWRRRAIAERRGKAWGPVLPAYDLTGAIENPNSEILLQRSLLSFADCIVKRDHAAASDVLLQPIASKAQDRAYARLIPNLGPCLFEGEQVKFSKPVLEGAMAEALYRAPAAAAKE